MTWSVGGVGLAYRHPARADFPHTHRKMSRTRETSQTSAIERRLRDDGPAADDNGNGNVNVNVNDNAADENDCDTDIDTDIDTDTDTGTDTDSNINDDVDGQLASKRAMEEEIISQFPRDHIVHCFGYGSGVFSQSLSRDKVGVDAGMLDLIFVVGDTRKFHEENLQRFPHHYAPWLRRGGPDLATTIQRKGFPWLGDAHVLFHVVDAETDNHHQQHHHSLPKMKYGVVDKKDLVGDLVDWDSLYLAGRMHKPTLSIIANDDDVLEAQRTNLRAAMATALLLSSESESGSSSPSLSKTSSSTDTAAASSLSWPALYRQIAALSYTGDFRMQVGGEDPLKLDKLVRAPGQLQRFHGLYRPTLQSFERTGLLSTTTSSTTTTTMHSFSAGGIEWNPRDPSTISHLLDELPDSLRKRVGGGATVVDREVLVGALSAIVAPAARNQSFKGIFTLGFRKTLRYASAKLSKGLFARK